MDYKELGTAFLDQASAAVTKRALVKRLERLGYSVSLQPIEPQPEAMVAQ